MADDFPTPQFSGGVPVSTPLWRVVAGMRAVLPVGWRVDVVVHGDPAHGGTPVLRALPATD
ncbi:hypothetical protein ABZV91_27265 [Nocardia sp. NPDC004568]|uniref:hypothetical protein n=1 Tax=Nocardia sp. NPDC004568 TaxID=3154551 RepID=UPI0033B8CCE0